MSSSIVIEKLADISKTGIYEKKKAQKEYDQLAEESNQKKITYLKDNKDDIIKQLHEQLDKFMPTLDNLKAAAKDGKKNYIFLRCNFVENQ